MLLATLIEHTNEQLGKNPFGCSIKVVVCALAIEAFMWCNPPSTHVQVCHWITK